MEGRIKGDHMNTTETCPKCNSQDTYQDNLFWICPSCSHEWIPNTYQSSAENHQETQPQILDCNGNPLANGDSVTVIKELKIKGSNSAVKVGTKVKNIRLTDAGDGHNIACKIDGLGSINLKSEFVKKA